MSKSETDAAVHGSGTLGARRHRSPATAIRRAFTLTELLVVIAIIGLLASLLMPALKQVLRAGENARCLANLGQVATAMLAYAGDNSGWIPPNTVYGDMNPPGVRYAGTYANYYSTYLTGGSLSYPIYLTCPTHVHRLKTSTLSRSLWPIHSYAPHRWFYRYYSQRIARIPQPPRTIYMAEKNGDLAGYSEDSSDVFGNTPIDQDTGQRTMTPGITSGFTGPGDSIRLSHRGRFNINCLDGHVESVRPQDTIGTPCDSQGLNPSGNSARPNRWRAIY